MEYYDTQKLKEKWGDKPCEHVLLEKMYYAGAFLIAYGCKQCGKEFTISEKLDMDEKRHIAVPREE